MKTKGCWPWKQMITFFRRHPRVFNRSYRLHPRVEAAWHSLKSLVGDILRNRTVQTIKAEIWSKITATTSSRQSEEATDFEPKPSFLSKN